MDNYEKQAELARELFLKEDLEQIARKSGVSDSGAFLHFSYFQRPYVIRKADGRVFLQGDGELAPAKPGAVMAIYDILAYSPENFLPCGRWVRTEFFHMFTPIGDTGRRYGRIAGEIDAAPEAYERACLALGGRPYPQSDLGFVIPVFERLEMLLQFWRGDEEFAPRLALFWDQQVLRAVRFETSYYIADEGISLIMEKMKEHS